MTSVPDVADTMLDYVRQLKRHASGRRALHIKLSSLERHMHEPYYRREVASALSPLVTKKGARLFALPNADSVLVTADLTLDDLAAPIRDVQKRLRESKTLAALDPVIGVTDPFIEWFDLEEEYEDFAIYAERLVEKLRTGIVAPVMKSVDRDAGHDGGDAKASRAPQAKKKRRDARQIDLVALGKAVENISPADVEPFVRAETVYAVAGQTKPVPVFIHQHLDLQRLLVEFTGGADTIDRWLQGHVLESLMPALLDLHSRLETDESLGTSFRVTCSSALSKAFDRFDDASAGKPKNSLIIEFSFVDALINPRRYEAAYQKVEKSGYKVALADVEPDALRWLNPEMVHASFIKLHTPEGLSGNWLSSEFEQDLADSINKIGRPRFILDGCSSAQDIEQGQRLGITLFQGAFLS